jgi:hypothetical protein
MCSNNEKLVCREMNGGKEIALPKEMRSSRPKQASASSSRFVTFVWETWRDPGWAWLVPPPLLIGYEGTPVPGYDAVFDLRTGTMIYSRQTRAHASKSSYNLALSATGEFLAESGDGVVELNRLAP